MQSKRSLANCAGLPAWCVAVLVPGWVAMVGYPVVWVLGTVRTMVGARGMGRGGPTPQTYTTNGLSRDLYSGESLQTGCPGTSTVGNHCRLAVPVRPVKPRGSWNFSKKWSFSRKSGHFHEKVLKLVIFTKKTSKTVIFVFSLWVWIRVQNCLKTAKLQHCVSGHNSGFPGAVKTENPTVSRSRSLKP